jgi:predicted nucleotidyltransferase component of viral defense system
MRLKVEINTREHFSVLGFEQKTYEVKSLWFTGKAVITTYTLEELLGTKLRALYQRKKRRDLFDLAIAFKQFPSLKNSKLINCFNKYMAFGETKVSRTEFEANLTAKLNDAAFIGDIKPLLRSDLDFFYDPLAEIELLLNKIINGLKIDK